MGEVVIIGGFWTPAKGTRNDEVYNQIKIIHRYMVIYSHQNCNYNSLIFQ